MEIKINSYTEKKLILLQRNELQSSIQKKIRKLFGRYLFTNLAIYFFNSNKNIARKANKIISEEFIELCPHLPNLAQNVLDIGSGLGMINLFINNHYKNSVTFTLLDRNFISKKIKYGFSVNYEAYNLLDKTKLFLINNGIKKKQINLENADDQLNLNLKFDVIISLISMGYHYPLNTYLNILRKCSNPETIFIFDIAEEYNDLNDIKKIFDDVKVLKKIKKKHSQLRVICKKII